MRDGKCTYHRLMHISGDLDLFVFIGLLVVLIGVVRRARFTRRLLRGNVSGRPFIRGTGTVIRAVLLTVLAAILLQVSATIFMTDNDQYATWRPVTGEVVEARMIPGEAGENYVPIVSYRVNDVQHTTELPAQAFTPGIREPRDLLYDPTRPGVAVAANAAGHGLWLGVVAFFLAAIIIVGYPLFAAWASVAGRSGTVRHGGALFLDNNRTIAAPDQYQQDPDHEHQHRHQ